jgi:hypothetical protein
VYHRLNKNVEHKYEIDDAKVDGESIPGDGDSIP